jgi:hypothetical protein
MIRLEGVSVVPAAKPPEFRRRALDLLAGDGVNGVIGAILALVCVFLVRAGLK